MINVQQLREDLLRTEGEINALRKELCMPYNPREEEEYDLETLNAIGREAEVGHITSAMRIEGDEYANSKRRLGLLDAAEDAEWQLTRAARARQVAELLARSNDLFASDLTYNFTRESPSPIPQPAPTPHPSAYTHSRLFVPLLGEEVDAVRGGEWRTGIASLVTSTTVDVTWPDGYITPGVPLEYIRQPATVTDNQGIDTDKFQSPTRSTNYPLQLNPHREVTPVGAEWGPSSRSRSRYQKYSPEKMARGDGIASTAANWSSFLRSQSKGKKKPVASKHPSIPVPQAPRQKGQSRSRSLSQSTAKRSEEYKRLFEPLKKLSSSQFDATTSVAPRIGTEQRFSNPRGWAPGEYHLVTKRR
eukprot:TRINITY_DN28934_c0_g1_i1.p1 TRINITY_DN28934_c0_g1~~TRINITY_DN28934_c0_g1_i1.p1  ORF type:complete len:360 (+),score=40.41 TRINITY_DN28934_c0_g1_i1:92-1171(+)